MTTVVARRRVSVRLTEVEAYGGSTDAASHAFGPRSARNGPMYGPPGTLYVYLSYGVHWCVNVVVGPPGEPSAVLLRGGDVVEGRTTVIERRGRTSSLADGPGKLGQALGLDGAASASNIWDGPLVLTGPLATIDKYVTTPRIGITRETERLWRFIEVPQ